MRPGNPDVGEPLDELALELVEDRLRRTEEVVRERGASAVVEHEFHQVRTGDPSSRRCALPPLHPCHRPSVGNAKRRGREHRGVLRFSARSDNDMHVAG